MPTGNPYDFCKRLYGMANLKIADGSIEPEPWCGRLKLLKMLYKVKHEKNQLF
jgi:hypothetical protein